MNTTSTQIMVPKNPFPLKGTKSPSIMVYSQSGAESVQDTRQQGNYLNLSGLY